MLDELAMRLNVQARMRWSPETATRVGRTRSVIRSLLLLSLSPNSRAVGVSSVLR